MASADSPEGFNAWRAGLGQLASLPPGKPLKVYKVDTNTNTLIPKQDESNNPFYYKALTLARDESIAVYPVYHEHGMPTFHEVEHYGEWNGIAPLYAFLASLCNGESALSGITYDYSDVWETTTAADEAVHDNLVIVRPHSYMGCCAYKTSFPVRCKESIDISIGEAPDIRTASADVYDLRYEINKSVRLKGQINWEIQAATLDGEVITWETIADLGDYIEHQEKNSVMRVQVAFDGDHPAVQDDTMIQNMCSNVATAGLWIDGNSIPQWVDCGTLPYNMGIAVLTVACLYRISHAECSPAYKIMAYPLMFGANSLTLGTVNYIPSYKPCSGNTEEEGGEP
jgi:hypothetical protein